jgi:Ni/Fe-hydrogenase 1 B-type cytochrome subunit
MGKIVYDHPIPARIMHQVNLVCLVLLVATGFFIHKPNFSLMGIDMNMARYVHFITAFVVLLNSVCRIYWAFFGAPRDIKYFMPEKENKGTLFPMMAYYYFLRKTKPRTSKYNGWQIHAIHYLVMWFFVFTTLFHVYLAVFEDFKSVLYMFFGIRPEEEEAYQAAGDN